MGWKEMLWSKKQDLLRPCGLEHRVCICALVQRVIETHTLSFTSFLRTQIQYMQKYFSELAWCLHRALDDNFAPVSDTLPGLVASPSLCPGPLPALPQTFSSFIWLLFSSPANVSAVTWATALVINTKIFQLWSRISVLWLNRSLSPLLFTSHSQHVK